jgi:hypothetical protein
MPANPAWPQRVMISSSGLFRPAVIVLKQVFIYVVSAADASRFAFFRTEQTETVRLRQVSLVDLLKNRDVEQCVLAA